MKILGIDPGLQTTGFALLENGVLKDFGVFTTPAHTPLHQRLLQISNDMQMVLKEHSPDRVAVEKLFFVQNITNGIAVAHARGVILLELERKNIPLSEVFPKEVKLAVCGEGNAKKIQIQKAVQQIFRLKSIPRPDDAADAIAIAYWQSQQKV